MRATKYQFRSGTWLALLALGFQLSLSFGHIHNYDAGGYERALALANSARFAVSGSEKPVTPAEHPDEPQNLCAICASMALAGSLVIPASPVISPATAQYESWLADVAAAVTRVTSRTPQQARAPPSVTDGRPAARKPAGLTGPMIA